MFRSLAALGLTLASLAAEPAAARTLTNQQLIPFPTPQVTVYCVAQAYQFGQALSGTYAIAYRTGFMALEANLTNQACAEALGQCQVKLSALPRRRAVATCKIYRSGRVGPSDPTYPH